jgi:hypothetical protein
MLGAAVALPARNLKFTGLNQNLDQFQGSYRDFQSNCWVNLRILGQPCEIYLRPSSLFAGGGEACAKTSPFTVSGPGATSTPFTLRLTYPPPGAARSVHAVIP